MNAPDAVALEHESWIAYLTGVVGCTSRALVDRRRGVVTILSGLPFDWFNQVLIERADASSAGLLRGMALARERGDPFVVRLREGIDDRFLPTVTRAGLVSAGEEASATGMVAFPIDRLAIARQSAIDLEIRKVTDAAGIDAHRNVVTAGFGSHPAVAEGTACPDLLGRPDCVAYVGYADGVPVVSGLGWRSGRTIGVFSIATIAPARRRGFGAAMTARVVADGIADGCDVASLQASVLGRPIYERLGFRTVVRYEAYADSPPGPDALAPNVDAAGGVAAL